MSLRMNMMIRWPHTFVHVVYVKINISAISEGWKLAENLAVTRYTYSIFNRSSFLSGFFP